MRSPAERKGRFRATNMVVSGVQIESSTNQHGDFTSDDAYIDGMCVSTAVIVILL